jgi:hypothetical protein
MFKYFPRQLFLYTLGLFFQIHIRVKQKEKLKFICVTSLVVPGDPDRLGTLISVVYLVTFRRKISCNAMQSALM